MSSDKSQEDQQDGAENSPSQRHISCLIMFTERGADILFNLKSPTGHSRGDQCCLCWCSYLLESRGAIRGKLHADVFAARNKHLAHVITLPVGLLFPSRGRRTHRSAALSLLAVAGVKDHNIISRQEGTRWWNMHEAEGHRTGVNIYTSAASQND